MALEQETDFSGGVAIITGAGSGIGAGLAERAVARGMKVALVDVNAPAIRAASSRFNDNGAQTTAEHVDVSDSSQMEALAERVTNRWGDITVVVNNAGIEVAGNTWEIPAEKWDTIIGVNLAAVFYSLRCFIPRMLDQTRRSHFVTVSSVAALRTNPYTAAYHATKHGSLALTECLAKELVAASDNVVVSVVLPGPVRTEVFKNAFRADDDGPGAEVQDRLGKVLEVEGMDPGEAAELIFAGVARGDLWIHLHPDRSKRLIDARAAELIAPLTGNEGFERP
jgi:NAD(P)-dependent dehydrogenase (short-subunit alcohol dehydrogenase family)